MLSISDTGDPAWQTLKKMPEAAYPGLALPRFLLRLPYGADTDSLEQFDFEEMTNDQKYEGYLWGNPCFACACLLGQAFSAYGWDIRPGAVQDVSGLPLHVYQGNGRNPNKALRRGRSYRASC
jgi:type VI secretion system protein ImpC